MSVLYSDDDGFFISHQMFISKLYDTILSKTQNGVHLYEHFFHINNPFVRDKQQVETSAETNVVKRKRKRPPFEEDEISKKIKTFISNLKSYTDIFSISPKILDNNICARHASIKFYESTSALKTFYGQNPNPNLHTANGYVFPPKCQFYCDNVFNMKNLGDEKYDMILLDPPWTNKYIKRKKKIKRDEGYTMMDDQDLAQLPINQFLTSNGLVCVWCTNSQNHIDSLKSVLFPIWNVKYVACWYWIKVTECGEFVCNFAPGTGKQPYERILFGRKIDCDTKINNPEENKFIASIPSSVHSHKPPLSEILIPYLPPRPKCLELFARYLLPNWTSYGLEALKFQHQFLYENSDLENCNHKSNIKCNENIM
ncbi:methyltransferase-like protein 4 [Acyrthosiphon pisum]|uniref:Methyltransferase-like protein 4 n=1 Tax=Acyrthosiphon pisum TaxID=7029 RepID=A0A8R1W9C2_ACYPI|nr:methyltransferase-like protein 4 [Acyrthosiphon pisum]|eukprot:XP_003246632.1 PREDICTED: methyltransferase-like protein 4 [Acyrthosiphon pisum]